MKKKFWIFFSVVLALLLVPVISKLLPIVHEKESYRAFFPKHQFQKKLSQPVPQWMKAQIEADFQFFTEISSEKVEKTYQSILKRNRAANHYRILDGKLYKYIPEGQPFSSQDHYFEKALKTLLVFSTVPDLDFLLSPYDGVAEDYIPTDFYLMSDWDEQAPLFAGAKNKAQFETKAVVLIPDYYSLSEVWYDVSQEILSLNKGVTWNRKQEIAFWRGGLTDTGQLEHTFVPHYRTCPRFKICKIAQQDPLLVDAGLTPIHEEMREALESELVGKSGASKEEHLRFKYLPCLDGHMCTYPGYHWRLLSNSVCFKQTSNQIQWFYSALNPYVHYIPVNNDLSNLRDQILWAQQHDQEVREISEQAQQFVRENLLTEDVYYYLYLVLQKYASLQKIDKNKIKKETEADPHWKCIQYRKRLSLYKSWNRVKNRCF